MKFDKSIMKKELCEYIGQYIFCKDIAKLYLTIFGVFMNKVIVDVDIFSVRVSDRVISKSYTTLIISIDSSSYNLSEVELFQQCLELYSFLCGICRGNILSFNRRSSHSWLFFRRL